MTDKRELFLTFFYAGKSPIAPGTAGTLASIPPALLILEFLSQSTLFLLSFLLFAIAIKQIDLYEKESGKHDEGKIVIDEVAGMWLAMSLVGSGLLQCMLAFLFFRFFDIKKPSIIGKIDKNVGGGLGVMGDDMVAGAFAGVSASLVMWGVLKINLL